MKLLPFFTDLLGASVVRVWRWAVLKISFVARLALLVISDYTTNDGFRSLQVDRSSMSLLSFYLILIEKWPGGNSRTNGQRAFFQIPVPDRQAEIFSWMSIVSDRARSVVLH